MSLPVLNNRVNVTFSDSGSVYQNGKYCARITSDHKDMWLGAFNTFEEASMAYAIASKKYHTHNPLAKA